MTNTHLTNLDLKRGLWIAEVRAEVFDRFVPSVEAVATPVAVPVRPLELLHALDSADNVTVVTAPQHLQTYADTADLVPRKH